MKTWKKHRFFFIIFFFSKTAMKMFGASKIIQNIVHKIFQKLTQKLIQKSLISACFLVRFFLLLACNFSCNICNKQKNCIAHLLIQQYKRAGQFHTRLFIAVWLLTGDFRLKPKNLQKVGVRCETFSVPD